MKKSIQYLLIGCLGQILLASAIWYSSASDNSEFTHEAFTPTEVLSASKLIIRDKEHESILLKKEAGWVLENYSGLVVKKDKIEALFSQLNKIKKGWPVATTPDAAERFEVSNKNSQKTLEFFDGDKLVTTIYLGTSPAHKKVHARLKGDDNVFAVGLSQYEIPANAESWFDNTLLQAKDDALSATIVSADSNKTVLTQSNGIWTTTATPEGKETDQDAVKIWLANFSSLRVKSLVKDAEVEKITVQNPVLTVGITSESSAVDYAFYRFNEKLFVKHYGDKKVFELSSYEGDPILKFDPSTIVTAPANTESPGGAETDASEIK